MTQGKILPILHIEAKPESGKPRIVGKGVTVQFLATFINNPEWTLERICEEFNLTPAEIYAAWSYYSDHKAEIDARIEADKIAAEQHRANPEYQKYVARLTNQRVSARS